MTDYRKEHRILRFKLKRTYDSVVAIDHVRGCLRCQSAITKAISTNPNTQYVGGDVDQVLFAAGVRVSPWRRDRVS